MAQLVYNYEKVQEKYSGKTADVYAKIMYPELQLITPGEHEHDDNACYEIILLDADENGFRKGLEVKVMSDTSGCKIETQEQVKSDHWELVDTSSDTNDDVVKSDNSITFTGEGTGYITQYENGFDSSAHAVMTFRCKMDELPSQLRPGDEIAVSITADVISEGEPITNAYMTCNLTVPGFFNAVSDTGANDSENGIYAGGNTFTGLAYTEFMTDCVHFKVPEKNADNDTVMIFFSTSAGETAWTYQWK